MCPASKILPLLDLTIWSPDSQAIWKVCAEWNNEQATALWPGHIACQILTMSFDRRARGFTTQWSPSGTIARPVLFSGLSLALPWFRSFWRYSQLFTSTLIVQTFPI
jgi:hypothetical protein